MPRWYLVSWFSLLALGACADGSAGGAGGTDSDSDNEGDPDDPNAVFPGELIVDEPTLHNLGFRWLVEGDDDGDAEVSVEYREVGETGWQQGPPMMRVHGEIAGLDDEWQCGNLLAGSALGLAEDTEYEVRFTIGDPDGVCGDAVRDGGLVAADAEQQPEQTDQKQ
jgi:hypothetical protein